jgi:outer membrane lipoprotein-sorting protein
MTLRTPKWIALALGLSLAVALLALAACGGGDSTNTSATATTSGRTTATQKPNPDATKTEQATETSSSSGDIASQLQALGNNVQDVTGKVTYTDTSTSGGVTTITFYSKSPNSRYDTIDSDGSSTSYIQTPDATYVCSSSADQTDQTCIQSAGSGTGSSGLGLFSGFFSPVIVSAMVAAAEVTGVNIDKSNETIAGTDATCFSAEDNGETSKFCFSDSGVLLATQTTDSSGTSGMVATAYSDSVSDSDFQPPYPVSTILAYPTG